MESGHEAICFPSPSFASAIARLTEAGFRAVTLEKLVEYRLGAHGFPSRTYAVTFDDGYESVYREAFPVLQEYSIPATVFVCPGLANRLPSLEGRTMLSWDQVREMCRFGIRFGAHTLTHPDLRTVPRDRAEAEIAGSQAMLEDRLGGAVRTFAYPFGRFDATSREIASRHYDLACADRLSLLTRTADPFALPRVDSFYLRSNWGFQTMLTPFFPAYIAACGIPRQCRRWVVGGWGR